MQLKDLFVSYKQVNPVKFEPRPLSETSTIYLNLDRAKSAISETGAEEPEELEGSDMSSWKVNNANETSSSATDARIVPVWTSVYKNQEDLWISDITDAYKRLGLPDHTIKYLIAKNALESNWGNTAQGAYNFGNITTGSSWTGNYVLGKDRNASGQRISQNFRAYDSLDQYVKDEIQLLKRIYAFDVNDDFDTFIGKLQGNNPRGYRYAEAPNYTDAVRKVYLGLV